MSVMWNALMAYPNPGEGFSNAFEKGMQKRREDAKLKAYSDAAGGNPQAMQALMRLNPEAALELQDRKQKQAKASMDAHGEAIKLGAGLIEQYKVNDEASYQQARQAAIQMGIDPSIVPERYDPAYVDGLVKAGHIYNPQKSEGPTALQKDYEFLSSKNPQLGEQFLRSKAEGPPQIVTTSDGRVFAVPRSQAVPGGDAGPPAAAIEHLRSNPGLAGEFDAKYGAGSAARILGNGGQTVAPSGAFR